MRRTILFLLVLVLCGVVQASSPNGMSSAAEAGRNQAPDFSIANLRGGKSGIADYRGKLVLLNFWATWCMPCREEMPGMEALWQKYEQQGLVILAVSVDEGSSARVEKFIEIFNLSFPVLLDPKSEINDLYEVSNMPTSFLIDRNGKIVSRIVGTEDWSSAAADRYIQELLLR